MWNYFREFQHLYHIYLKWPTYINILERFYWPCVLGYLHLIRNLLAEKLRIVICQIFQKPKDCLTDTIFFNWTDKYSDDIDIMIQGL